MTTTTEYRLLHGDCVDVMRTLEANSVDAIVTDPPYDLLQASRNGSPRTNVGNPGNPYAGGAARAGGFMGKAWDATGVAFKPETWEAAYRVMKPGAHLLAFGGTRTWHRLTTAIEDAGFEIRDSLTWLYGSGFPKSLNLPDGVGTALKPAFEPIVLARKPFDGTVAENVRRYGTGGLNIDATRIDDKRWPANVLLDEEAASLLDAEAPESESPATTRISERHNPHENGPTPFREQTYREVQGYGDAGGPSRFFFTSRSLFDLLCEDCLAIVEPCFAAYVAESLFPEEKTIVSAQTGVQALLKQGYVDRSEKLNRRVDNAETSSLDLPATGESTVLSNAAQPLKDENVLSVKSAAHQCVSCGTPIALVDVEELTRRAATIAQRVGAIFTSGRNMQTLPQRYALSVESLHNTATIRITANPSESSGSVLPVIVAFTVKGAALVPAAPLHNSRWVYSSKAHRNEREYGLDDLEPERRSDGREKDIENPRLRTSKRRNDHPTVKPVDLFEYLVRLITPPNGLVLDPFVGSGTAGIAALNEDKRFIGIDVDQHYLDIAQRRIERRTKTPIVRKEYDDTYHKRGCRYPALPCICKTSS